MDQFMKQDIISAALYGFCLRKHNAGFPYACQHWRRDARVTVNRHLPGDPQLRFLSFQAFQYECIFHRNPAIVQAAAELPPDPQSVCKKDYRRRQPDNAEQNAGNRRPQPCGTRALPHKGGDVPLCGRNIIPSRRSKNTFPDSAAVRLLQSISPLFPYFRLHLQLLHRLHQAAHQIQRGRNREQKPCGHDKPDIILPRFAEAFFPDMLPCRKKKH